MSPRHPRALLRAFCTARVTSTRPWPHGKRSFIQLNSVPKMMASTPRPRTTPIFYHGSLDEILLLSSCPPWSVRAIALDCCLRGCRCRWSDICSDQGWYGCASTFYQSGLTGWPFRGSHQSCPNQSSMDRSHRPSCHQLPYNIIRRRRVSERAIDLTCLVLMFVNEQFHRLFGQKSPPSFRLFNGPQLAPRVLHWSWNILHNHHIPREQRGIHQAMHQWVHR
jgi:hypothetical protein